MAGVFIQANTNPSTIRTWKNGRGWKNVPCNGDQEVIDILSSIWDNRLNFSPEELNQLRKFGTKTLFEELKVTSRIAD